MFRNLLSSARRHTLVVLMVTMALLSGLVPGAIAQTVESTDPLPAELKELAKPGPLAADPEAAQPADPQPGDPQLADPAYIDRLRNPAEKWEPGKEIFAKRTATAKTLMGDEPGKFTTRLYSEPIHYRAGDRWSEIDSSLGDLTGGKRKSKANKFGLELAENADAAALAKLQLDPEHSVAFGLDKAAKAKGKASKDSVTYSNVMKNTDVKLTSQRNGLKEELILAAPGAPTRFVFPLTLKGLTASLEKNGDVVYKDSKDVEWARTPQGYMFDSKVDPLSGEPASSTGVAYALIPYGKGTALEVTLTDRAWMDSPDRVWPLVVDPMVHAVRTLGDDTYVMSNFNRNNSGDLELKVGTYDGGAHIGRSLARFDTSPLFGAGITAATLYAYERHSWNCGVGVGPVFRVNEGWSGADTRWGGPATDPNQATGGWYPGGGSCPNRLAYWNVLPQVTKMASLHEGLGAFSFRAFNEGDNNQYKKFRSFEAGNGPYLSVDYNAAIAPGPPPNLVATANNDGTVGVTWGNSSTQGGSPIDYYLGYSYFADGTYSGEYQIRYCTGNCNYALFSNLPQNQSQ